MKKEKPDNGIKVTTLYLTAEINEKLKKLIEKEKARRPYNVTQTIIINELLAQGLKNIK